MKRKYNFKAIISLEILYIIVVAGISALFGGGKTAGLITFITLFLSHMYTYVVAAGLIRDRNGSFSAYLEKFSTITFKVILINVIMGLLEYGISKISLGGNNPTNITNQIPDNTELKFIIIGLVLNLLITLLTAYTNYVLADSENEGLSIFETLSLIFKTGFSLIFKTIKTYLFTLIIPGVIWAFLIFFSFIKLAGDGIVSSGILFAILIIIAAIYAIVIGPIILAKLSDNYLDYKGDEENPISENEEDLKIIRKI